MTRTHPQYPNRLFSEVKLPFDYELRPASGTPRELIVLLHGYGEAGRRILRKLEPVLPKDAVVLAPNAPFPMPYRTDEGFKVSYTWYLYNPATREYFIDMALALDFLEQGVRQLGFSELPKRVIGFSQGGYLAPFVGKRLGNTRQVVGIACEYLHDELEGQLSFRVDGVHGEKDEIVKADEARSTHAEFLKKHATGGVLTLLENTEHRIDEATAGAVAGHLSRG